MKSRSRHRHIRRKKPDRRGKRDYIILKICLFLLVLIIIVVVLPLFWRRNVGPCFPAPTGQLEELYERDGVETAIALREERARKELRSQGHENIQRRPDFFSEVVILRKSGIRVITGNPQASSIGTGTREIRYEQK